MFDEIETSRQKTIIRYLKKAVPLNDTNLVKLILEQKINIKEDVLCYCIEKAAYYGRVEILNLILGKSKCFRYNPEGKNSKLNCWITANIEKGMKNEHVGWTCGPDSAPWPSTDGDDYVAVLDMLNERK